MRLSTVLAAALAVVRISASAKHIAPYGRGARAAVRNDSAPRELQDRIVGGKEAVVGAYPSYAIATGSILCGANVIHTDILLTAAHCHGAFVDAGVSIGVSVLAGANSNEVVSVQFELQHPYYDSESLENDIMIVKLKGGTTAPVTLYSKDSSMPAPGDTLTVIGFGHTATGGSLSPTLLEVSVVAIDQATCNAPYQAGGMTIFPDTMFCNRGTDAKGKSTGSCQGDSGGPLFDSAGVQIGIVSWGQDCGSSVYPDVNTKVSAFGDWITETICCISDFPPPDCVCPTRSPSLAPRSVEPATPSTPSSAPKSTEVPSILESTDAPSIHDASVASADSQSSESPHPVAPQFPSTTPAPTSIVDNTDAHNDDDISTDSAAAPSDGGSTGDSESTEVPSNVDSTDAPSIHDASIASADSQSSESPHPVAPQFPTTTPAPTSIVDKPDVNNDTTNGSDGGDAHFTHHSSWGHDRHNDTYGSDANNANGRNPLIGNFAINHPNSTNGADDDDGYGINSTYNDGWGHDRHNDTYGPDGTSQYGRNSTISVDSEHGRHNNSNAPIDDSNQSIAGLFSETIAWPNATTDHSSTINGSTAGNCEDKDSCNLFLVFPGYRMHKNLFGRCYVVCDVLAFVGAFHGMGWECGFCPQEQLKIGNENYGKHHAFSKHNSSKHNPLGHNVSGLNASEQNSMSYDASEYASPNHNASENASHNHTGSKISSILHNSAEHIRREHNASKYTEKKHNASEHTRWKYNASEHTHPKHVSSEHSAWNFTSLKGSLWKQIWNRHE